MTCAECGEQFTAQGRRGPTRRLCSPRCRKRASRRAAAEQRASSSPFPERMTSTPRWTRADGKRPVQVDGTAASSTRAETWTAFDEVQQGAGDGFGIMLGGGLGCYDLDGALDREGKLWPWARKVLDRVREPVIFAEVSVSGRGLHVFVLAPEQPGQVVSVPGGTVERYYRARFIRVTGNVFEL